MLAGKMSGFLPDIVEAVPVMNLQEACEYTGLSERTLRRLIKSGQLPANMADNAGHRRWEIGADALDSIGRKEPGQVHENGRANCPNCEWLQGHVTGQMEAKDRQIAELHILLQQTQAALPAPRDDRSWWRRVLGRG